MTRKRAARLDLLSLLSEDRRQAVVEEALSSRVQEIFEQHGRATLGKLVARLVDDELWAHMQQVRVDRILREDDSPGRGRPRYTARTLDQLVEFIMRKPGLRSEQIQREINLPKAVVKASLARLRLEGRVRTTGDRRTTTYVAS